MSGAATKLMEMSSEGNSGVSSPKVYELYLELKVLSQYSLKVVWSFGYYSYESCNSGCLDVCCNVKPLAAIRFLCQSYLFIYKVS